MEKTIKKVLIFVDGEIEKNQNIIDDNSSKSRLKQSEIEKLNREIIELNKEDKILDTENEDFNKIKQKIKEL